MALNRSRLIHADHIDAIALNGAHEPQLTMSEGRYTLQLALYTTKTLHCHGRITNSASSSATTLATSEQYISRGGEMVFNVGADGAYFYGLLVDDDGAHTNGGANDYLLVTREA